MVLMRNDESNESRASNAVVAVQEGEYYQRGRPICPVESCAPQPQMILRYFISALHNDIHSVIIFEGKRTGGKKSRHVAGACFR